MVRTVRQGCFNAYHRVACKHAFCHTFGKSLFNGREEVFGNCAAEYLFFKYKSVTVARFKLNPNIAELSVPARLFLVPSLNLAFAGDRFAVRYFGYAESYFNTEF